MHIEGTDKIITWKNGSDPDQPWERVRVEPRGTLFQLVSGQSFCHLLAIDCPALPGAFRGRHFHRRKLEEFFVVSGRLMFHWYDLETHTHGSFPVETGDRVRIFPLASHSFVAQERSILVEFCNTPYDEADSIPSDPVALAEGREPFPVL